MFSSVGALVLVAAFMHAGWNTMLHGSKDRSLSMAWICLSMGTLAAVACCLLPLPAAASWPYILLSGIIHVAYNLFLVRAYETGDLGMAYPIARGSSPMLVALGAFFLAGESLTAIHALGVILVSAGIVGLALQRGQVTRRGLGNAFLTGATIACYTVVDGMGVRLSGGTATTATMAAASYTAWLFLLFLLTPALHVFRNGMKSMRLPAREAATYGMGGLVSAGAYGIVIWAMQHGAMGALSALRETSVLFAALLGKVFLHERLGAGRLVSCLVIVLGALALGT
ncbi:EamA family transporter [Noviherbaspirillum galbum]|uniref:EamA family transporter n=1 Tax=Noviherbaspirillum galbum TaxID=2709383 RepID=A0A6B3SNB1_9BURK|nr:EamA family transporter [Noviherbaspirillum galbum]NEX61948.1 EamA family transporter [Noviherbaspirillum galbum]